MNYFLFLFNKIFRSQRHSSNESSNDDREDSLSTTNINRKASVNELSDLASRRKAEIDRLAELERERIQLL